MSSTGDLVFASLAGLCFLFLVAIAVTPGLLVAFRTRARWDDGRKAKRAGVALLIGGGAGLLLSLGLGALIFGAASHDERGLPIEALAPIGCAPSLLGVVICLPPLLLMRGPPREGEARPTPAPSAGPRTRRARLALALALAAYLPAFGPLFYLFHQIKVSHGDPHRVRAVIEYGLSCGGLLALLLNLASLGLAVSALRGGGGGGGEGGGGEEPRPVLLAGWVIAMSALGALCSPSLLILSWLLEGFVRSVGGAR